MKLLISLALSLFSFSALALQCETTPNAIACTDLNAAGAVICTLRGDTYDCRDFYPRIVDEPAPPPEVPNDDCRDWGDCDD